jgi:hypothetical protein
MSVTVQRSPEPVDLTAFAECYARVVRRIAGEQEAMPHAG